MLKHTAPQAFFKSTSKER